VGRSVGARPRRTLNSHGNLYNVGGQRQSGYVREEGRAPEVLPDLRRHTVTRTVGV
jgi:hypothetical protein